MLIGIIGLFFLIISFYFFKPFFKNKDQRKFIIKGFFILMPMAILLYGAITYFTYYKKPESFIRGVELLENDNQIIRKIGVYDSYSYYKADLPKIEDNPASFKISLKGSKATIFLTCEVRKDNSGVWRLTQIKQDSLISN